jgi:hypothetical protein
MNPALHGEKSRFVKLVDEPLSKSTKVTLQLRPFASDGFVFYYQNLEEQK